MESAIITFAIIQLEVNKNSQLGKALSTRPQTYKFDITVVGAESCKPWTGDILRKRPNTTSLKQFLLAIGWKKLLK